MDVTSVSEALNNSDKYTEEKTIYSIAEIEHPMLTKAKIFLFAKKCITEKTIGVIIQKIAINPQMAELAKFQ